MEGMLNISKIIAALMQHEKLCVSAHGPVLKMRVRQHLCANETK